MVGLPHPTRRKKEGKNLSRKHLEELSERRRAFFARIKRKKKYTLNPKEESLLSCRRSYLEEVHALPGSDVVGEKIIYNLY